MPQTDVQRDTPFSPETDTELLQIQVDTTDSTNTPSHSNNNNNSQHQLISQPEKRAMTAAYSGEIGVLQLLCGEALYVQLTCLEKEQQLIYHRSITKLYRAQAEALEATLLFVIQETGFQEVGQQQALIVLPRDKAFDTLQQTLTQCFQINADVFKPGSVAALYGLFSTLPTHTAPNTAVIKGVYQTALQKNLLSYLKIEIPAKEDIPPHRGRLAVCYQQMSQLPSSVVIASETHTVLRCLFDSWVSVQQQCSANEKIRTTLADQLLAVQETARKTYQGLKKQYISSDPPILLLATTEATPTFTWKRWEKSGTPTVSWTLKRQDSEGELTLLEAVIQRQGIPSKQRPQYQACVKYLVNAHLVNKHYDGIQSVLLSFFENPTCAVDVALLDTLFETVETWHRQELLWFWQQAPSPLETLAVEHAQGYQRGKRSQGQSVMDFFRRQRTCEKLRTQATMLDTFSMLSNELRGDETLAALLFYIFRDENRITRFFHPHESLYQQAIAYRDQTAQAPIETLGFVSQQRKERFQQEQAQQKKLEEAHTEVGEARKKIEEADKKAEEAGKKAEEADKKTKTQAEELAEAKQRIAELEQQAALAQQTQHAPTPPTQPSVNPEETQNNIPRSGPS